MSSTRPFSCELCSQTFTRNENLERHRRSKHGGNSRRPFECVHCQTQFSRRDTCKRHARRCRGMVGQRPVSGGGDIDNAVPQPAALILDAGDSGQDPGPLDFGDQNSGLDETSPSEPVLISTPESMVAHTSAYFEYFHPSFPLLHRPTFGHKSPPILRNIVVSIGALYLARTCSGEESTSYIQLSQQSWDSGCKELTQLVNSDWRKMRKPWIMQAWLLHIIYGAYMGDACRYSKAKTMLRSFLDAAHDLGLLRPIVAASDSRPWVKADARLSLASDEQALYRYWMSYIDEESTKLSMYALIFLDFHILSPCNLRALASPIELDWELPLPTSLWESNSAEAWLEKLDEESSVLFMLEHGDSLGFPCPISNSLSLATQSLMSDMTSPYLLAALAASPIATLFVLSNLDAFVRDLTRCYYQFPPGLADPSAFHILTQSQNRRINAALCHISDVVKGKDSPSRVLDGPVWRNISHMVISTKIALYKPDDLLISGIIDSSVVEGLATATHLTLGLYPGARRGQVAPPGSSSGDDAVLVVLDEVMDAISSICETGGRVASCEAPWATVATYRILLAVWRSLRWAARKLRTTTLSQGRISRRYEVSAVIFNSVMEVVRPQKQQEQDNDVFRLSLSPDEGEQCFAKAVLQFWEERDVWAIGSAMKTVIEEAILAGY